jgi:hypothetical protein
VGTDRYSYMDEDALIDEISRVLHRIHVAEDRVQRAEEYYWKHKDNWFPVLQGMFLDRLERKKELIAYEWDIVRQLGEAISAGRNYQHFDI